MTRCFVRKCKRQPINVASCTEHGLRVVTCRLHASEAMRVLDQLCEAYSQVGEEPQT